MDIPRLPTPTTRGHSSPWEQQDNIVVLKVDANFSKLTTKNKK